MLFQLPEHVYFYYYRGAEISGRFGYQMTNALEGRAITGDNDGLFPVQGVSISGDHATLLAIREEDKFTN